MIRILLICLISLLSSPSLLLAREVVFYHTDNVGTPVAMTNSTGAVVWRAHDKPFGEEFQATASPASSRRFIGKEKDKETGLVYIGARYLDPVSGRFLQPDPVGPVDPMTGKVNVEMLTNPQRLNRYAYGLKNPYRYIDPDGETPIAVALSPLIVIPIPGARIVYGAAVAGSAVYVGYKTWQYLNESNKNLPNQGDVTADVEGAPVVDAGKQGKHVSGHNNEVGGKSKWNKGETGVRETQEAWINGEPVRTGVRIGKSSDGKTVKVHQDGKGKIHGYPVPSKKKDK